MGRTPKSVIEYRIYDLPPQFPALCLTGDEWLISDVLSNRLHFHNCMEIGFCHSGWGMLIIEDERISFEAGDVFIIPRHVPHTTCSGKGTKSLWSYLFIDIDALEQNAAGVRGTSSLARFVRVTPQDFPRLHFLCVCMLEEMKCARADRERMTMVYALALSGELRRLADPGAQIDRARASFALKPALEYIYNSYMEPCRIDELADICHLSQTHFRRLFASIMGMAPLQFINSVRISRACELLDTTDDDMPSIAHAVGIGSIPSFNRNFQRIMGLSPREYRRASTRRHDSPRRSVGLEQIRPYQGWMYPEARPSFVSEEEGIS